MENQSNYTRLREELENIVVQVRSKDLPLEKCLDLFDEALKIGGQCAEAIEGTDFLLSESENEASSLVDPQDDAFLDASDDEPSPVAAS